MDQRPNFYQLLGLAPSVDDWPTIERAILEQKAKWNKEANQGHLAARRKAELYQSMLGDIRSVMSDAQARRAEAEDCERRIAQDRAAKGQELQRSIDVLKADGSYTLEAVAKIVKSLGGLFSETEVLSAIDAAGVQPMGRGGSEPPLEKTDAVTMASARTNLDLLGLTDLYALLELQPVSSPQLLRDRADELNRDLLRRGRKDVESNARKELAGVCLDVFKTPAGKEKYDNALADEAMLRLREQIELAGRDGFLSQDEQGALVKQGQSLGVSADRARRFLVEYAKKRKWNLQRAAKPSADDARWCGYCSTLNKPTDERCAKCGEALVQPCPKCMAPNPTERAACQRCGCCIGDAPVVKALLRQGTANAQQGDFAAALAAFDRALVYWPGWEPAQQARREAVSRRDERETRFREIEALIRQRKLVAARSALERAARDGGAVGAEALRKQVDAGLAAAESSIEEGDRERGAGRLEQAFEKYERALLASDDLEAARRGLAACPPAAPSKLSVEAMRDGFRLSWMAVSARGTVSYRVLRKVGGVPRHAEDGTLVAELATTRLDDSCRDVAGACHYAVYCCRSGITSREAASSGPHLLLSNAVVTDSRGGDGRAALRWIAPPGCSRVEVWREAGAAPAERGRGRELRPNGNELDDSGLSNGTLYGYLLVAVFPDPERAGAERFAPGVKVTLTSAPPPPTVTDLRCVRDGRRVNLTWTAPSGASVQIRQSGRVPEVAVGTTLSLEALEPLGHSISVHAPGSASVELERPGLVVFVPVTLGPGCAVVGQPVVVTTIEDVSELTTQSHGQTILLRWCWPAGTDEVLVCYSNQAYPAAPDEAAGFRVRVTRAAYERSKGWEVRAAQPARHFFCVFACVGGAHSSGVRALETMGQTSVVRYRVVTKKAGLLRRTIAEAWLELQSDDAAALPALVVVGKARSQPLSPADGTLITTVAGVDFARGAARIPVPAGQLQPDTYLKLFFQDGRRASEIRLMPGNDAELRVG
jgi:hypothetical protein